MNGMAPSKQRSRKPRASAEVMGKLLLALVVRSHKKSNGLVLPNWHWVKPRYPRDAKWVLWILV